MHQAVLSFPILIAAQTSTYLCLLRSLCQARSKGNGGSYCSSITIAVQVFWQGSAKLELSLTWVYDQGNALAGGLILRSGARQPSLGAPPLPCWQAPSQQWWSL